MGGLLDEQADQGFGGFGGFGFAGVAWVCFGGVRSGGFAAGDCKRHRHQLRFRRNTGLSGRNFPGLHIHFKSPGGGSGSKPEGEAWVNGGWGFAPPPPPPRTDEQIARDVAACEKKRDDDRAVMFALYNGNMAVCAARQGNWTGYLAELGVYTASTFAGYAPQDCQSQINRFLGAREKQIDDARDICVSNANRR